MIDNNVITDLLAVGSNATNWYIKYVQVKFTDVLSRNKIDLSDEEYIKKNVTWNDKNLKLSMRTPYGWIHIKF